jgi:hypothetical protein
MFCQLKAFALFQKFDTLCAFKDMLPTQSVGMGVDHLLGRFTSKSAPNRFSLTDRKRRLFLSKN